MIATGAPSVVVVDTGLGNLRSVEKALAHVGARVEVSADPDRVAAADRVVVPGQGAFGDCARALDGAAPLGQAVRAAIARGTPYLGLCLGLQILFEGSDEAPAAAGLGLFAGQVKRLPGDLTDERGARLKVPHLGWNGVAATRPHPLLPTETTPFYFVHSFAAEPADPSVVAATAEWGGRAVVAAVARAQLFAVQFHPEKSQAAGLTLCAAFLGWRP